MCYVSLLLITLGTHRHLHVPSLLKIFAGAYWGANGVGSGQEYRWLNMYKNRVVLHGKNVERKGNVVFKDTYLLYKRPE